MSKKRQEGKGVFDAAVGCTVLYCNTVKTTIPRHAQRGY